MLRPLLTTCNELRSCRACPRLWNKRTNAGYNISSFAGVSRLHLTVTLTKPYHKLNRNPNATWLGLPPKSNGFFHGPCANFPPNTLWNQLSSYCVILLTNKPTNADEKSIASLAELETADVVEKPCRRAYHLNGQRMRRLWMCVQT